MIGSRQLRELLSAVGALLEEQGESVSIVVVGGASLNLSGLVERATDDVDVIARASFSGEKGEPKFVPPDPMPDPLQEAVERVARDFGLDPDWMNTKIGPQWDLGIPPSLKEDLTWQTYGGLRVGIAGRRPLLALKLFAAVDRGTTESVHYQDLLALEPTEEELKEAAEWVRSQDASPVFAEQVDQVIEHARDDTESH